MRITACAPHFGAAHEKAVVLPRLHRRRIDRLPITRPARARFELVLGTEQRQAAADALVSTGFVIVPVFTREGAFRAFLPRALVLFRRELRPPFLVCFCDVFD